MRLLALLAPRRLGYLRTMALARLIHPSEWKGHSRTFAKKSSKKVHLGMHSELRGSMIHKYLPR